MLSFFWVYLPETKGRSLEDMSLYCVQITGDRTVLEVEQELSQISKSTTNPATELERDYDDEGPSNALSQQSKDALPPVV